MIRLDNTLPLPETSRDERSMATVNRVDQLLVLRGIASLLVFFGHITPSNADGTIEPFVSIYQHNLTWLLKPNGLVCVWIFFCLSGYLIGKGFYTNRYPISREGIGSFYLNRIKRIVPLIYFVVLVTIAIRNPQVFRPENINILWRLLTFTYSSILDGNAHFDTFVNYPLWSISVEMQFYLLAPLGYIILRFLQKKIFPKSKLIITLTVLLVIGILLKSSLWLMIDRDNILFVQEIMYTQLFSNLDIFILGMLINPIVQLWGGKFEQWVDQVKSGDRWMIALSWVIIAAWILYATYHVYAIETYFIHGVTTSFSFVFSPALTAIITGLFIFLNECKNYHSKRPHLSIKVIGGNPSRLLEWLGILSFGIYVWHMPVAASGVMNVFTIPSPSLNYFANLGLCFLLTVVISLATYYLIERPFLLHKKYHEIKSKN